MRAQHIRIVLFSLLVSFPAIASDWVYIGTNIASTSMYVDKQSIKGDISSRKFWSKTVLKEQRLDPISGKYYILKIEYEEIDCNNNITKLHESNFYSADGNLVNNITLSPPDIIRIVPDSAGEAEKEYVCSFKPTK